MAPLGRPLDRPGRWMSPPWGEKRSRPRMAGLQRREVRRWACPSDLVVTETGIGSQQGPLQASDQPRRDRARCKPDRSRSRAWTQPGGPGAGTRSPPQPPPAAGHRPSRSVGQVRPRGPRARSGLWPWLPGWRGRFTEDALTIWPGPPSPLAMPAGKVGSGRRILLGPFASVPGPATGALCARPGLREGRRVRRQRRGGLRIAGGPVWGAVEREAPETAPEPARGDRGPLA